MLIKSRPVCQVPKHSITSDFSGVPIEKRSNEACPLFDKHVENDNPFNLLSFTCPYWGFWSLKHRLWYTNP